jgi:hypothetical protein
MLKEYAAGSYIRSSSLLFSHVPMTRCMRLQAQLETTEERKYFDESQQQVQLCWVSTYNQCDTMLYLAEGYLAPLVLLTLYPNFSLV